MTFSIISRQEALIQNLPRYFTGRPCKYGHIATRWTQYRTCTTCEAHRTSPQRRRAATLRMRRWRKANPERNRELAHKADPRASVIRTLRYYQTPKGKIVRLLGAHNYRARGGDKIKPDQLAKLKVIFTKCYICHRPFSNKLKPTIDHIIPLSGGGSNDFTNLALACGACNSGKRNRRIFLI